MLSYNKKESHSTRPTLICIHGFLGNSEEFLDLFSPLSSHYNLMSVALPYHHSSSEGHESIETYCQSLKQLLDHLKIKKASFYGYSMGGRIALSFAKYYPEYINTLFIESAHSGFQNKADRSESKRDLENQKKIFQASSMQKFLKNWYDQPIFTKSKNLIPQKSLAKKLRLNLDEIAKIFNSFHVSTQAYTLSEIQKNKIPLLYFTGDLDLKYTIMGLKIKELYPKSMHYCFKNSDHAVHLCSKDEILEKILSFNNNF